MSNSEEALAEDDAPTVEPELEPLADARAELDDTPDAADPEMEPALTTVELGPTPAAGLCA